MKAKTTLRAMIAIAFVLQATAQAATLTSTLKRYVVTGVKSGAFLQMMSLRPGAIGIQISHDLTYHDGFVMLAPEETAFKLRNSLRPGLSIEEDHEVFAADSEVLPMPAAGDLAAEQRVPWGISAVRADSAFVRSRGSGITVCVVDTGVSRNHPDLKDNIAGGEAFVDGRREDWGDDNGHGTHVAGTIAALDNGRGVVGVAPDARIFAMKVLNAGGSGRMSDLADGVRSCVANGAKVINMSLASPNFSEIVAKAVRDASRAGVIIVAASGNWSSGVAYPAKLPEVIAVSGVMSDLRFLRMSNTGPEIAFTAPGAEVLSTTMDGRYGVMTGTSMASPHVAGVAALFLSANSKAIRARDIGLSSYQQGHGLVDASLTVE